MATRSPKAPVEPGQPAPARKAVAASKKAAAPKPVPPTGKAEGAEALLRAGLKALGNVRNDVVKHHTNAIERLLGIQRGDAGDKPTPPLGLTGLDTFGLRKFEDVFDQRVATALQRLGLPSAQELQALRDEVAQLRAQLDAATAAPAAPAGAKRKR